MKELGFSEFSKWLESLSPTEFATIASLTGLIIGQFLTQSEQNAIGNWLECVGQVLLTMGTKPYINNYNKELLSKVLELEKEIEQLKSNLKNTNVL